MKKVLLLLVLLFAVVTLTGCGKEGFNITNTKELSTKDLSINDFDWSVEESKCSGSDCFLFKLKNNSKYDIIGVDIKYDVKDNATDDELKAFDSFMLKNSKYIEAGDSYDSIILSGYTEKMIESGNSTDDITLALGFKNHSSLDYPTSKQYNLMEPSELKLGVIYRNKIYFSYYNFDTKTWKFDKDIKVVDEWTKSELGTLVAKPGGKHFIVFEDNDEEFDILSFGITQNMYEEYIKKLESSGFNRENSYSYHFEGKNSDGHKVVIYYYESEKALNLTIKK